MSLSKKKCIPCSGGTPTLSESERNDLLKQVSGWQVEDEKKIVKSFSFKDFNEPMKLANKIWEIAESEGHHPDLLVAWGKLKVEIWTHAAGGLTESDFILAAKIDQAS
ncbi:MAG: 4a-hydroxytetrahydrobiopterin dehydratase [Candidatus Melainabacteria bacterium]|jgi:4a-hydroxytetrahydrobiopterin dehydratase|nr:4a-hydroxytetrahydrobiopterin dehydratase [Candidatus Melainabacteria bacterium]